MEDREPVSNRQWGTPLVSVILHLAFSFSAPVYRHAIVDNMILPLCGRISLDMHKWVHSCCGIYDIVSNTLTVCFCSARVSAQHQGHSYPI